MNLHPLSAEQQVDENIVWENPETPSNADDYLFVNGMRMVRPYYFEFLCNVKRRWEGKTIVDLFAGEFRQRPREYYIRAVDCGRIRVSGTRVAPSYVVRDSEKISHFVHRHEPPVLCEPVIVLEKGPDVITVNKPPSVPVRRVPDVNVLLTMKISGKIKMDFDSSSCFLSTMVGHLAKPTLFLHIFCLKVSDLCGLLCKQVHPCGQYRKNTVVGILQAEHKTGQLFRILLN